MTKAVVLIGFLLAFAAGLVVGMEKRPHAAPQTTQPSRHRGGWLTAELGLTPQQQEQMRKIWSETARMGGREHDERRRQCRKERDDAIASLVRPEDKPKYDEIINRYSEQMNLFDREVRTFYESAIEKTKGILTPEQRTKYEAFLEKNGRGPGPRERGPGPGPRGDRERGEPRGERGYEHGRQAGDRATSRAGSDRPN